MIQGLVDGVSFRCFSPVSPFTATFFLRRFSFLSTITSAPTGNVLAREMADSWQKHLYQRHAAFAVDPLRSEDSVQLLDVLVKTSGTGSSPILHKIGSMFKLGSKESQETADRLREGLKRFESNTGKDSCSDLVRGYFAKPSGSSLVNLGYRQLSLKTPKLYIVVTIFCPLALA